MSYSVYAIWFVCYTWACIAESRNKDTICYTRKHTGNPRGWSDVLKVSCILRHRGVQLTLAYSWARPTILLAGKGRGDIFISSGSLLSFLFLFLPCPSYSSHPLSLLSLFSLPLGDDTKWSTRFGVSLNPQSNQSKSGNPNVVSVFKNGRKSTKFIHST